MESGCKKKKTRRNEEKVPKKLITKQKDLIEKLN